MSTSDEPMHEVLVDDDVLDARIGLIDAAEKLVDALRLLNVHGDTISHRIATQRDGCPYGEVHDGLATLAKILWPTNHERILREVFACGITLRSAVLFVSAEPT